MNEIELLQNYAKENRESILANHKYLIGCAVESLGDITVDWYVNSEINLSNGETCTVIYRTCSEQEDQSNKEDLIIKRGMEEYFKSGIIGESIKSINLDLELEDCLCLSCNMGNGYSFRIPIKFSVDL